MPKVQSQAKPIISDVSARNLLVGSAFAIFIIWGIGSVGSIWLIEGQIKVLPLSEQLLGLIPNALGGFRPIFPAGLTQATLFALCLIGPLSLVALLFLSFSCLPGSRAFRSIGALIIVALCYPLGAPGEDPHALIELCYFLLLFSVFLKEKPKLFRVWAIGAFGLGISLVAQAHSFSLYWFAVATGLATSIHFLFVEKWHISVHQRQMGRKTFFNALGLSFLIWAILYASFLVPNFTDRFVPGSNYFTILIGLFLVLIITYLDPWKTQLWMRIATLMLGGLLSAEFVKPTLLLVIWLGIYLIVRLMPDLRLKLSSLNAPTFFWKASYLSSVLLIFSLMLVQVAQYSPQRSLLSGWATALVNVQTEAPREGLLIFGNAIELFALFHDAPLVQNAPILLESSEEKLNQWLTERKLEHIFVDRGLVEEKWKEFIDRGVDPSRINHSIIQRMLRYEGEPLTTKTLEIDAVQSFAVERLPNSRIYWIKRQGSGS